MALKNRCKGKIFILMKPNKTFLILQNFDQTQSLDNKANGIWNKKSGKFYGFNFVVRMVCRVEKNEKSCKFKETACHKQEAQGITVFLSCREQIGINGGSQQIIYEVGRNDLVFPKGDTQKIQYGKVNSQGEKQDYKQDDRKTQHRIHGCKLTVYIFDLSDQAVKRHHKGQ